MGESNKPTLDRKAANQMNLNVIQRLDSSVEQVIATTGHVALYDFDTQSSQWSRKEVEGSLFLVKRQDAPRFRFLILNKKGVDNYWEDVGNGFSCESQTPYILYKNKSGAVVGIWFYEKEECEKFAALFQKIVSTFAEPEDAVIDMRPSSSPKKVMSHPVVEKERDGANGGTFWDKTVQVPKEVHIPGMTEARQQVQQVPANPLAQVFAGMKVAPAISSSPPSTGNLSLLTPQHLSSQVPTSQQQVPQPARNQGAALLESLTKPAASTAATMALAHGTAQSNAEWTAASVQGLLKSLADNETFCTILAEEIGKHHKR